MTTPSTARAAIKRAFCRVIDAEPTPTQIKNMLKHFGNACAYCGEELTEGDWDKDHLTPSAEFGSNHISNRAPSCKPCNGNERLNKPWEQFLKEKCEELGQRGMFEDRSKAIKKWISEAGAAPTLDETLKERRDELIGEVQEFFTRKIDELKKLKAELTQKDERGQ